MKTRQTLTLMCGLPRVGKSVWVEKNKGNAIVVSTDEIRREIFGHQFHSGANKFVFAVAEAMTSLLLKQGRDVIVDATHLTHNTRNTWYPMVKKYGVRVKLIWVYADKNPFKNYDMCLERNSKSPKDEQVPINSMYSMSNTFEEPNEGWMEIIEYRNN